MGRINKSLLAVSGAVATALIVNEVVKNSKAKEKTTKEQSKIDAFLEEFERYEEKWEENGVKHIFTVIKPSDTAKSLVYIYRGGETFDKHNMDRQELENFINFANDVWGYGLCEDEDKRPASSGVMKYSNGLEFSVPEHLLYKHITDI